MAAVSGLNNDELFQSALRYLTIDRKYQIVSLIEKTPRSATYRCSKEAKSYFVKITNVDLTRLRHWKPGRGELLVQTTKDPRICKIIERAYITEDGNHTEEASGDIRLAIDVSPMIEGKDLWYYRKDKGGKLDIDEVLRLAIPIAEQILSLHEMRIVHRDIKSQNIVIDKEEMPHLVDGEFARSCNTDDEPLSCVGTKFNLAPEVTFKALQNKDLFKLDSFSFGLLLFEMITGNKFLEAYMVAFVNGSEAELSLDALDECKCDPAIKILINSLLKRSPRMRMNMRDALDWLKALQARKNAVKVIPDGKEPV